MEERFSRIPGVVTVGIFAHRGADVILVADNKQVRVMEK
jgi:ribose 5-phosphate isomerase A